MCPTDLDADQVIKAIYDEPANRIRTDAAVTATFGDLEVTLRSDEDSVSIGNTAHTQFAEVTSSSELKVKDETLDDTNTLLFGIDATLTTLNSKFVSGTDIGDVTINNAAGAGAVNIQDGGNSITVDGTVAATQSGTWNVNNISGTVSLPTGASTSALQTTGNNSLSSIDGKLNTLGQKTSAASVPVVIASDQSALTISGSGNFTVVQPTGTNLHTVIDSGTVSTITNVVHVDDNGGSITVDGSVSVSNFPTTQPISAVSLPLPTGAATSALQTQPGVDIGDVTVNNASGGSAVNIQDGGNSITVDGTVAATQSGTWSTRNLDASGTGITSTLINSKQSLDVFPNHSVALVLGTVTAVTNLTYDCSGGINTVVAQITGTWNSNVNFEYTVNGTDWTDLIGVNLAVLDGQLPITTDVNGIFAFNTVGLSAIRFTNSGSMVGTANIALGGSYEESIVTAVQAVTFTQITGSLPLPTGAATETTLSAINSKLVSGTDIGDVTINNASGAAAVNIQDGGNSITVDNGGTFAVQAAQSGTWTVQPGNTANTTAWKVDGSAVTQPVSGTVTANAGTGNFTVIQGTGTNLHTVIDSGTTTVTQATGTNLHAVVDSGTITTVSTITNLSQLNGAAIAMNTGTRSAGTQRVTIATDDIVPASQSGTWNITNVSGTVTLPTGASTAANQTTELASLSSIDTKLTSQATATKQDTGNTSLSSIDTRLTTLNTQTDGLEASLTSIDSNITTLLGKTFSDTSILSNVASSASNVTLLSSTAGRKGFALYNDSTSAVYVKFGTTASATSFTIKMAANSYYENPYICYRGRIDAIWVSANGSMRITELT